jgi:hypothetical protein
MKIPFGLRTTDDRMVDPTEVENGAQCGCVCPECRTSLVAKQGDIMEWHFAHDAGAHCAGGVESAIHRMAKQMVLERQAIFVPERTQSRIASGVFDPESRTYNWQEKLVEEVQCPGLIALTNCREEETFYGKRPDLLATSNGDLVAIEIAFTHFCDDAKLAWLEERKLSTLEVNVFIPPSTPLPTVRAELERRLFETSAFGKWLVHAHDGGALARLDGREKALQATHMKEDNAARRALKKRDEQERRKEAFLESIREIDSQTWKLSRRVTLRIAHSRVRCTLKAYGHFAGLNGGMKEAIAAIARNNAGQFNREYHHFEFRVNDPESLYEKLRREIIAALISIEMNETRSNQQLAAQREHNTNRPPPLGLTSDQEELFEERAAILEHDAGLSRDEAERLAIEEIRGP